jgi:hypothetical protein
MRGIYVENSKNSKLSNKSQKVDVTYAPIKNTCPSTCELKDSGCYASLSYVGMTVNRLEKQYNNFSTLEMARVEALAIDHSYNGGKIPSNRHMRLHVSGDSRTIKGSKLINSAVGRWKKRGDGTNKVWSYTHAWKSVPAKIWSHVSMLASIDKVEDAILAREQGYAPAIVVDSFDNDKVFSIEGSRVKWIPCPAQTSPGNKDISCADCKLCTKSDWLLETNRGIAFAAHGVQKDKIKRRLAVIKG